LPAFSTAFFFNPDVIKLKSPVISYTHFPNALILLDFLVQKCSEVSAILFTIPTFLTAFQPSSYRAYVTTRTVRSPSRVGLSRKGEAALSF